MDVSVQLYREQEADAALENGYIQPALRIDCYECLRFCAIIPLTMHAIVEI